MLALIEAYACVLAGLFLAFRFGERLNKRLTSRPIVKGFLGIGLCAIAWKIQDFAYIYPGPRNNTFFGHIMEGVYFSLFVVGLQLLFDAAKRFWKFGRERQAKRSPV